MTDPYGRIICFLDRKATLIKQKNKRMLLLYTKGGTRAEGVEGKYLD
jgi:hypothetical protein